MRKVVLALLPVIIFFCAKPHLAHANVVINEIMYDLPGTDTDHEWVEIYNNGASSVDLTGWKFSDGSNHNLNAPPVNGGQGSLTLAAGGYAVLAGDGTTFVGDHPGFAGTVIDTVMNLPNTGATLKIIKSDSTTADSVTYNSSQGASGDGNSLQLISGSWTTAAPTPGAENHLYTSTVSVGGPLVENTSSGTSNNTPNQSTGADGTGQATSPSVSVKSKPEEKKMKVQITSPTIAFVGMPFELSGTAFGPAGEKLFFGRYFWNFGDGDSKETKDSGNFSHTYFYSDEYTVSLEYYSNNYSQNPDATAKIKVKVIPPALSISRVGDEKDFFVELANDTDYDMDISRWSLASLSKNFFLPRNTTLQSGDKMIISDKVTGLSVADKDSLKLITSQGEVAYEYVEPEVTVREKSPPQPLLSKEGRSPLPLPRGSGEAEGVLQASAVVSDVPPSKTFPYLYSGILMLFLGGSGAGAYFVRRRGVTLAPGSDFKILDE